MRSLQGNPRLRPWCIDRAIKAEQTRLISHLSFCLFIIELSLWSVKTNNTLQLLLQQICLSRVVSNVTNNESKLWKTFRLTSIKPHNHNPNNNCVSVNFFASVPSSVFALLFIPSFNVLSSCFYGWSNSVVVPTVWVLINLLTQLL